MSVFPLIFKYAKKGSRREKRAEQTEEHLGFHCWTVKLTAAIQIMPVPYWIITVFNLLLTSYSYLMKCHIFRGRVTLK
jgi:hypothetical protein